MTAASSALAQTLMSGFLLILGLGCTGPLHQTDTAPALDVGFVPISTSINAGLADTLRSDRGWTWVRQTTPQLGGLTLMFPKEWEPKLQAHEGQIYLDLRARPYTGAEGYDFLGIITTQTQEVGAPLEPRLNTTLTEIREVDRTTQAIQGRESILIDYLGQLKTLGAYRQLVGAIVVDPVQRTTLHVSFLIKEERYMHYAPAILHMLYTAASPNMAGTDPQPTRPSTRPQQQPQWPSLATPLPGSNQGQRDAALVVAIEDYLLVPDVPGARRNATDWYRFLRDTRGIPQSRVRLLRDREATAEEIRDAVQAIARTVEPGGTLWFVFIGHGAPSQDGQDGLLVGADAQQTPRSLAARSIARSDLLKALAPSPQSRTVVVLDACFSGQTPSGPLVAGLQPLLPVHQNPPHRDRQLVLTAARSDQFAGPLGSEPRPAFSYLVLGALRGWADRDGDAIVTAHEVLGYTRDALNAVVSGRTQTPELIGDRNAPLHTGPAFEQGPDLDAFVLGR